MTLEQFRILLESINGFTGKVAYETFPLDRAPELPFICFIAPDSNNFAADGIVYHKAISIQVELYSKYRDRVSENLIEQKLTDNGIFYQWENTYLDDEKCYMTIYRLEI